MTPIEKKLQAMTSAAGSSIADIAHLGDRQAQESKATVAPDGQIESKLPEFLHDEVAHCASYFDELAFF